MATRLYLHNTTHSLSGTLPSGEQSSYTSGATPSSGTTLKVMNTTIGTSQTSHTITTVATTNSTRYFLGYWVSPPLSGAHTITGSSDNITGNFAVAESNTNLNLGTWPQIAYIWRPSTGAKIGEFWNEGGSAVFTEPSAASTETGYQIAQTAFTTTNAIDGDVIVFEMWLTVSQAMATAYTITFYFDGTVVTNGSNTGTTVSDHASYIEFSQNLTFQTPVVTTRSLAALGVG